LKVNAGFCFNIYWTAPLELEKRPSSRFAVILKELLRSDVCPITGKINSRVNNVLIILYMIFI